MTYINSQTLRQAIREKRFTSHTSGEAPGFVQANLVILRKDWAWDFFQQRHDLIRVILFELLNDEDQLDMVYKFFDSILVEHLPTEITDRLNDQSVTLGLASFFYGLVPFLMTIAIGDQWAQHYQIPPENLKHHFVIVFNRLFIRHIMDVLNEGSPPVSER